MKKIFALVLLFCFCTSLFAKNMDTVYQNLATEFVTALNEGNTDKLVELFDVDVFAYKAMSRITDNKKELNDLISGIKQVEEKVLLNRWFSAFYNAPEHRALYLRTLDYKGQKCPLVRLDMGDAGLEYLILYIGKTKDTYNIVDFYTASSGKENSVALADATQLLLNPSENLILRILGKRETNADLLVKVRQIGTHYQSGNFQKTWEIINTLPPDVRISRTILDISVQAAMQISDDLYLKELGLLNQHFGHEDNTVFMLIDYHFLKNNYGEVQKSIDRMINIYGKDAALLDMKSSSAFMAGDYTQAIDYAQEAIKLEKDYEDVYWTLVTIYVTEAKYDKVVLTLKDLSQKFGYEFARTSFEGQEFYSGFVGSPVFDAWLPK